MEVWKKIKDFEDYEVSNLGNVKSLKYGKQKILKPGLSKTGYFHVNICYKTKLVHQLVAIAFLNHKPCGYKLVVNHKDFNKLNNKLENLEIVTSRENCNHKHIKSSSKYTGVSFKKSRNKWISYIHFNGKQVQLGSFVSEIEASNAYENKLKELNKLGQ